MLASRWNKLPNARRLAGGIGSPGIVIPQTPTNGSYRRAYRWAILVTAAVLMLAVSAWQFRDHSSEDQLSLIADNWVAFENLTSAESLELIATEDRPNEIQPNESQSDADSDEQADWLVEAAREFYLAKNEGAAG